MTPEITQHSGGKSLRLIRPSIVVLCGPSASGKSTFAKKHFRPTQIVSSDDARALVCDDERDQRFNTQAFNLVHYLVETRLTLNRLCVVDSTALTVQARRDLLTLARKCQVQTTLILFNVPLATCIERDAKRERSVGQAIVERQYQNYEASKDSIRQEGFDHVVEFQESDQDKVQIDILFRPVQRPQRVENGDPSKSERWGQRFIRRPNGNGAKSSPSAKVFAPSTIETPPGHGLASPSASAPSSPLAPQPAATSVSAADAHHSPAVRVASAPSSAGKNDA